MNPEVWPYGVRIIQTPEKKSCNVIFNSGLVLYNIQGVNDSKVNNLQVDLTNFNTNFICLTEDGIRKKQYFFYIEHFLQGSHFNRTNTIRGGVASCVNNNIFFQDLELSK